MTSNYLVKNLILLTVLSLTAIIIYAMMGASAVPVSAAPLSNPAAASPLLEEDDEGGVECATWQMGGGSSRRVCRSPGRGVSYFNLSHSSNGSLRSKSLVAEDYGQ